jgi:hypothetical protein
MSILSTGASRRPTGPITLSVPEAGKRYFGLSRNGSYDAAARGDIPTIRIGRLLRCQCAQWSANSMRPCDDPAPRHPAVIDPELPRPAWLPAA